MKIDKKLLYEDVEKPGIKYPPSASREISIRYSFACQYIMSKDILEVGFGSGYGINALISKASSYHGIDYLKENVNFVKKKFQNKTNFDIKLEQGDAHNLSILDFTKDTIIAFAVVYYLDLDIFLRECKRVLRVDGNLIFCQTNPSYSFFQPSRNTTKYYSYTELEMKLREIGFSSKFYGISEEITYTNKYTFFKKAIKFIKYIPPLKSLLIFLRKSLSFKDLPNKLNVSSDSPELESLIEINNTSKLGNIRIMYIVATKSN